MSHARQMWHDMKTREKLVESFATERASSSASLVEVLASGRPSSASSSAIYVPSLAYPFDVCLQQEGERALEPVKGSSAEALLARRAWARRSFQTVVTSPADAAAPVVEQKIEVFIEFMVGTNIPWQKLSCSLTRGAFKIGGAVSIPVGEIQTTRAAHSVTEAHGRPVDCVFVVVLRSPTNQNCTKLTMGTMTAMDSATWLTCLSQVRRLHRKSQPRPSLFACNKTQQPVHNTGSSSSIRTVPTVQTRVIPRTGGALLVSSSLWRKQAPLIVSKRSTQHQHTYSLTSTDGGERTLQQQQRPPSALTSWVDDELNNASESYIGDATTAADDASAAFVDSINRLVRLSVSRDSNSMLSDDVKTGVKVAGSLLPLSSSVDQRRDGFRGDNVLSTTAALRAKEEGQSRETKYNQQIDRNAMSSSWSGGNIAIGKWNVSVIQEAGDNKTKENAQDAPMTMSAFLPSSSSSSSSEEDSSVAAAVAVGEERDKATVELLQPDCLPGCQGLAGGLHRTGHHPRCVHHPRAKSVAAFATNTAADTMTASSKKTSLGGSARGDMSDYGGVLGGGDGATSMMTKDSTNTTATDAAATDTGAFANNR